MPEAAFKLVQVMQVSVGESSCSRPVNEGLGLMALAV